jgi:hypothetical protein
MNYIHNPPKGADNRKDARTPGGEEHWDEEHVRKLWKGPRKVK